MEKTGASSAMTWVEKKKMVKSMKKMDVGFERVLAMVGSNLRRVLEKKQKFNLCKVLCRNLYA